MNLLMTITVGLGVVWYGAEGYCRPITPPCSGRVDRSWRITTRTGHHSHAGTDEDVYMSVKVGSQWSDYIEIDNPGNDFESGATGQYDVTTKSCGVLRAFRIKHVPRPRYSHDDSWYIDWATVTDLHDPAQTVHCQAGAWVNTTSAVPLECP